MGATTNLTCGRNWRRAAAIARRRNHLECGPRAISDWMPLSLKRNRDVTHLFPEMGQPDVSLMHTARPRLGSNVPCDATSVVQHFRPIQVRPCRPTRAFRELIIGIVSAESHHAATSTQAVPRGFSGGFGRREGPGNPGSTSCGGLSEKLQDHAAVEKLHKALTVANIVVP